MSDKDTKESNELSLRKPTGLASNNILDRALQNLSKDQIETLSGKAAEEALRLQAKNREQLLDSQTARVETQDHIEAFNDLGKDGRMTRHTIKSKMKTGSGDREIESKSGAACFVATSAFNSEDHPTVIFLRQYRDSRLLTTSSGRKFVIWYYTAGPKIAAILDFLPAAKPLVRFCLKILTDFLRRGSRGTE